LARDR
jgi:hypothetical protein